MSNTFHKKKISLWGFGWNLKQHCQKNIFDPNSSEDVSRFLDFVKIKPYMIYGYICKTIF